MEFKVVIAGLAELTDAFAKAPTIVGPILQNALAASQATLAQNTTRGIVPWRTGFLVQSFRWQLESLSGSWFPTASYAPDVEFGTSPHVIYPVNKEALWWPGLAHPVKKVNHPGSKPNPYMERILATSQDSINTIFGIALGQIVAAIST